MSQYAFDSTLNLSVKIIIIIETLAILFSIIFIVIITMMIISDNKKFISTLKVMGYKIKTINKIFFKSIIPSFIIAIFVAIPFVFAILIGMKLAIINFGHVLIPLDMVG
jgi:ABC-type antimicrobial peptide transport system permease subunit